MRLKVGYTKYWNAKRSRGMISEPAIVIRSSSSGGSARVVVSRLVGPCALVVSRSGRCMGIWHDEGNGRLDATNGW